MMGLAGSKPSMMLVQLHSSHVRVCLLLHLQSCFQPATWPLAPEESSKKASMRTTAAQSSPLQTANSTT